MVKRYVSPHNCTQCDGTDPNCIYDHKEHDGSLYKGIAIAGFLMILAIVGVLTLAYMYDVIIIRVEHK